VNTRLPGSTWLFWVRNLALRVGVLTGIYLSAVFVAWLLIANRLPFLDRFAVLRNWGTMGVFGLIMLVPVGCFLRRPQHLFASGIVGWFFFTLTYRVLQVFFRGLEVRLRPAFQVFMLGAVVYGLVAVAAWVVSMAWEARHHSISASRRHS
jgi:hypothetical protein